MPELRKLNAGMPCEASTRFSLRLFIAVCEERNIAIAARREAIVPSAVSKRIRQMEEEAGVRLLERGRRGVSVTAAGEALLRYARELLQLLDRMQAELGAFASGVQGHVRVFGSKSALAQFLPVDVSTFADRYLDVRVSLEEREIWEVVRGVEEGRADVGVCWDAVDLRGLRTFPYHRDHLAVVDAPQPSAGSTQVDMVRGNDRSRACRYRRPQHHEGDTAQRRRCCWQADALSHSSLDSRCGLSDRCRAISHWRSCRARRPARSSKP